MRTNSGQSDYFRRKLSQHDSGWFLKVIITAGNTLLGENDSDQKTIVPANLCVSIGVVPFVGVSEADSFSWEMASYTSGSQTHLD